MVMRMKCARELDKIGSLELLKGDTWDYIDVDAFECKCSEQYF